MQTIAARCIAIGSKKCCAQDLSVRVYCLPNNDRRVSANAAAANDMHCNGKYKIYSLRNSAPAEIVSFFAISTMFGDGRRSGFFVCLLKYSSGVWYGAKVE